MVTLLATARTGRTKAPPLEDPSTYPLPYVSLRVAGEYLKINERTVRARIEEGKLPAIKDGKVYKIAPADLEIYRSSRDA